MFSLPHHRTHIQIHTSGCTAGNSAKAILQIGEQVMAKPLRGRKFQKKLSLKERSVFATWVGIEARTNEHVVVIGEGRAAIRVRSVLRRPASDRWNVDAVKAMQASPRVPNPENLRQAKVMPEGLKKKKSRSTETARRFKNRFAGFKSSNFASSKSPRAFL